MRYKTNFGDTFLDHLDEFSDEEAKSILKKIEILAHNPNHNSLRTQKLRRTLKNRYESSVNMGIRLIWQLRGDTIFIEDVGRHDILKKYG